MKIDTVKAAGSILTAWLLIGGCFVFLNKLIENLSDPNLAQIPETSTGIIIGGLIAILTMGAQSVFQSEAIRSAARQQQQAYDKGLATPTPPPPEPEPGGTP